MWLRAVRKVVSITRSFGPAIESRIFEKMSLGCFKTSIFNGVVKSQLSDFLKSIDMNLDLEIDLENDLENDH